MTIKQSQSGRYLSHLEAIADPTSRKMTLLPFTFKLMRSDPTVGIVPSAVASLYSRLDSRESQGMSDVWGADLVTASSRVSFQLPLSQGLRFLDSSLLPEGGWSHLCLG